MTKAQTDYVDQVLKFWEFSSSKIERYRCKFERWEYDPVFGPRDTFKTYSKGVIKFSHPDKGLFKVDQKRSYQPGKPGERPQYLELPGGASEHWVCNGKSVFEFDASQKRLVQRELPPDVRGTSISEGPLPFLFGAKAADIKARYWIHAITPKAAQEKGEYWLEAVPKRQEDAADYRMVHVIIDRDKFLPVGLVVFDRNARPGTVPSRSTFRFADREVNFSLLTEKLKFWNREFYEPSVPKGWQKVVIPAAQVAGPTAGPASRTATARGVPNRGAAR